MIDAGERIPIRPRRLRRYRGVSRRTRRRYGRHAPRVRTPKGLPGLWTRFRRLIWAWWFWTALAIILAYTDHWHWAIGLAIAAFVANVVMPTELSPIYGLDHQFDARSGEFLPTITGATGVPFLDGNSLEILNNGDEFYPAMLEAIESAEHSITIEAYIYWAGSVGRQFAEALADKARSGIPVKILLDAIGSGAIGDEILGLLADAGCQIAWYHPIRWYTLGRYNNRTHRKTLVVDGEVGFTGGAGIADHWLGNAQDPQHWRDIQIRIEGPGVMPLQSAFAQNWLATTGEIVTGDPFYPDCQTCGSTPLQTVLSSPETGASAVRIMYYVSIVCARKSVYIANPYFVPDQVALDILIDARRRGVDVKIMVAGRCNDSRLARFNSVRLYGPLLECGVEIYEYQRTMLHHKIMVVDDCWATVGTTNFDNRSFSHNSENNVCFHDAAHVDKLRDSFCDDLQHCQRVCLDTWRRRPLWIKAAENVASLLQDQV